MAISGLKATHGALTLKIGPFAKTVEPGHGSELAGVRLVIKFNLMERQS